MQSSVSVDFWWMNFITSSILVDGLAAVHSTFETQAVPVADSALIRKDISSRLPNREHDQRCQASGWCSCQRSAVLKWNSLMAMVSIKLSSDSKRE